MTLSRSEWSRSNVHSFEDVLEPDAHYFEDGITRRLNVTSLDMTLSRSEWSRSPSAHRAKPS